MQNGFQILPLALHVVVGFHFNLTFSPFKTVLLVEWYKVGKQECVGSFHALFGKYAYHLHVHNFRFMAFQCP